MPALKPPPGFSHDEWKNKTPAERRPIYRRLKYKPRPRKPRGHIASQFTPEAWSLLEKKRKRAAGRRKQLKNYKTGAKSSEKFCRELLHGIKGSSARRKHPPPEFTLDDLFTMSQNITRFEVDDNRGFDIVWTNGYFNSASLQRLDNSIGYTKSNVVVYPSFLNTRVAFTKHDLLMFDVLLKNDTPPEIVDDWRHPDNTNKFCRFATRLLVDRCTKTSFREMEFDFESNTELEAFLKRLFQKQGGLCAYSGVPLRLTKNSPFTLSLERVDPIKGYTKDNIVFICQALNSAVYGEHNSIIKCEHLHHLYGSEEHRAALQKSTFNQEYWNKSIGYTPELQQLVAARRIRNAEILERILFGDLKILKTIEVNSFHYSTRITIQHLKTKETKTFDDLQGLSDEFKLPADDVQLLSFVTQKLPVLNCYIVIDSWYPKYVREHPFKFDFLFRDIITNQIVRFNTIRDTLIYFALHDVKYRSSNPIRLLVQTLKTLKANPKLKFYNRFVLYENDE